MKFLPIAGAMLVLTACSQAEEPAPVAEEAAEAPEEMSAVDGGPAYGTYRVTLPDGSIMMDEVRPDGTYTSTMADGTTVSGTWVQKPDAYCSTAETEGAIEICYPEEIDENGVWTAETPEGEFSIIERVEPSA